MDSIRWLPVFIFGGFGIGQYIGGNYRTSAIILMICFIAAVTNRFVDIWINRPYRF
jgi:hypothetical protein